MAGLYKVEVYRRGRGERFPAWHSLGYYIDYKTAREAARAARCDGPTRAVHLGQVRRRVRLFDRTAEAAERPPAQRPAKITFPAVGLLTLGGREFEIGAWYAPSAESPWIGPSVLDRVSAKEVYYRIKGVVPRRTSHAAWLASAGDKLEPQQVGDDRAMHKDCPPGLDRT